MRMARLVEVLGLAAVCAVGMYACDDGSVSATRPGAGGANTGGNVDGGGTEGGTTDTGGDPMQGECSDSSDCGPDEICVDNECVTGCAPDKPCDGGLACCSGVCIDTQTDMDHCGSCDAPCDLPPNMQVSCAAGMCGYGPCEPGFSDCDGQVDTGCETMGSCSCTPGSTQSCYPGAPGTENVGPCVGGTQKCNQTGTAWSLCSGFVVPGPELCGNNIDEDCSGVDDDVPDVDNDGWTSCDNDCCETTVDCSDPSLVNPGAYEVLNNGVDDDCQPATSDSTAPAHCSTGQKLTNVTADDLAMAFDLCQFTTSNPPLDQKVWGVVDASLRLADGSSPNGNTLNEMEDFQGAVQTQYGNVIVPQVGPTMMGISTGHMRYTGQPDFVVPGGPGFGGNPGGVSFGRAGNPPAGYLAQNGGLPTSIDCNQNNCDAGEGANDSINLRLEIRVPTNALSFAYQFRFFTSEYLEYACTQWNDFYLALLTSSAANLPADGNISFDALGNPVSVNNGFFEVCPPQGCYSCPAGTGDLAGTGMETGGYGGGTVWLQTTAPILAGETMVLELMVFDVSDAILDSLAIIDAFEWSIDPSMVGTGPPG